jgi:hypothetical protein
LKNVIAFSLWGDKPIYWVGALRNIELAKGYYPGWICRFYVDKNSRKDLIETLKGDNVEVVLVDSKGSNDNPYYHHGMFWRFNAAVDEDVDVFLSRDCDSRISEREVAAVNEWLESDKDFHIMRDHPYHAVPILGGMWGCRKGIMREIGLVDKINQWCSNVRSSYSTGIDQDFLREIVYPLIKDKSMEHSEFNLNYGGEIRNFPYIRNDYEFVGDVFDENDNRHPDYWKIIKNVLG